MSSEFDIKVRDVIFRDNLLLPILKKVVPTVDIRGVDVVIVQYDGKGLWYRIHVRDTDPWYWRRFTAWYPVWLRTGIEHDGHFTLSTPLSKTELRLKRHPISSSCPWFPSEVSLFRWLVETTQLPSFTTILLCLRFRNREC